MIDFNELFKNHQATRVDCGPLSIITYKKTDSFEHGLRYIFDNELNSIQIYPSKNKQDSIYPFSLKKKPTKSNKSEISQKNTTTTFSFIAKQVFLAHKQLVHALNFTSIMTRLTWNDASTLEITLISKHFSNNSTMNGMY